MTVGQRLAIICRLLTVGDRWLVFANRRAVAMLNPLRDKNKRRVYTGGGRTTPVSRAC